MAALHYIGWVGGSLLGTLLGACVGAFVGHRLGTLTGHTMANAISQRTRHVTPDT